MLGGTTEEEQPSGEGVRQPRQKLFSTKSGNMLTLHLKSFRKGLFEFKHTCKFYISLKIENVFCVIYRKDGKPHLFFFF